MLSNLKRNKNTPTVIHTATNHFITEFLVKTDWPSNKTEEILFKFIHYLIYAKLYAYSFSLVLLPIYFLNQGTKEIRWKQSEWIRLQPREKVAMLCEKPIHFFKSEFACKKSWVLREGESLLFQVNQSGRHAFSSDPAKAGKKLQVIINVCICNSLSLLL